MDIGELAARAQAPDGAEGLDQASLGTPLNLRQKLAQVRREVGYTKKRGKNSYNYTTPWQPISPSDRRPAGGAKRGLGGRNRERRR